jgi:hypothetical protein
LAKSLKEKSVCYGFGHLGCVIAAGLSLAKFGGFWLTVGHYFCGWIYVVYYLAKYGIPGR